MVFPARGYRKNGQGKGISVGILRLKFGIKLGAEVRNLRKMDVWQGQLSCASKEDKYSQKKKVFFKKQ
jgi:hypothetical protein